ncbi:hypothetical protein PTSG_05523 [Salpingoeca rosetta]|uniref:Uncharacterized protein n=1 Tax=Salpingoeca rosetta (strain ATCC 50818 / BSB-021) TaxID=946362 RepID=F2UBG3_SALR5|nr:uncharacterized protein PTSG_05523 [Salpingoeca rosetta]EGD73829.1 hypothetical protein PTSG_05523 [Salpingoeca rosetta]|eukprot:XP_004993392.1 hypothetical protein PTSG_05523 [Salpingoeca rosetta]
MVPVAVLALPFVANVLLRVFLEHGLDLTQYIRLATEENVTLVVLVVYTVWLVHSVTFAVLLPNPRTKDTQAAAVAQSLGRWWTTQWTVLSIAHLLCKTAFRFNPTATQLLTLFDGCVVAIPLSTLSNPASFPQLAGLATATLGLLQRLSQRPGVSVNDIAAELWHDSDVTLPILIVVGLATMGASVIIDRSTSSVPSSSPNGFISRLVGPKTNSTFVVPSSAITAAVGRHTSVVFPRKDIDAFQQEGFQAEQIELDFGHSRVQEVAHTILSDGGLFVSFHPLEAGTVFCNVYVNNALLDGCPITIDVQPN